MDPENKEGVDLSGLLRDESATGGKFEEHRVARSYFPKTPKIIKWVMKYSGGYIKDEKQASYVLLGFVALAIIVSLFLFFGGSSDIPKGALENPEYGLPVED